MTAVVGAVGTGPSMAALTAAGGPASEPTNGKYDFDTVYSRIGTDCVKWDQQIKTYGQDSIAVGMGIADMDFRAAPAITKALVERVKHENWGYMDLPGSYSDSIVNWNKRRYGIDINPDLLLHATGVHPALISALRAFSPPGSKIIVQSPVYNAFYSDIALVGCKAEENPLKLVNGRYAMDFEDLERRISHDTNTIILCNPQNPTGTLANEAIVRNSISFSSASKSFNLAAAKCAYMFSTNADYIARVKATGHRQDINTLGMVACRAAYNEGADWLDQVVAYIDGNHEFVEAYVRANLPLVGAVKPQGTYLSWLDVSGVINKIGAKDMAAEASRNTASTTVTPSTMVERYFVKQAKVQMNAGAPYGLGGEARMRMNIATSRRLVELALSNIAGALKKA